MNNFSKLSMFGLSLLCAASLSAQPRKKIGRPTPHSAIQRPSPKALDNGVEKPKPSPSGQTCLARFNSARDKVCTKLETANPGDNCGQSNTREAYLAELDLWCGHEPADKRANKNPNYKSPSKISVTASEVCENPEQFNTFAATQAKKLNKLSADIKKDCKGAGSAAKSVLEASEVFAGINKVSFSKSHKNSKEQVEKLVNQMAALRQRFNKGELNAQSFKAAFAPLKTEFITIQKVDPAAIGPYDWESFDPEENP